MVTFDKEKGDKAVPLKMNPWSAYIRMFKKTGDFRTRSRRSEYWYAYLMDFIIRFIMIMILTPAIATEFNIHFVAAGEFGALLNTETYATIAYVTEYVYLVYCLVVIFPQLTLTVRRLHDIGMSGIWAALTLFPAGSIVILFFMTKDSMPGMNMYGPNPKDVN